MADDARVDGPGGLRRVAVVGAGLVGGSVAGAFRAVGASVTLTDRDADVRRRAAAAGLADRVVDGLEEAVRDAELVVVAVPANVAAAVLHEAARSAPLTAVLTDVASLKGELVPTVEALLERDALDPGRFVGGHPMAGSERSGPEAADPSLFQGATWVLTPTNRTDHTAMTVLSAVLRAIGARVLALEPDLHDQLVAVTSHLPQVAASALADVAAETAGRLGEAVLAVAGGGFRDTTRIAASDPDLWVGILRGNRDAVVGAIDALRSRLDAVRDALTGDDDTELRALLDRASTARRGLVRHDADHETVDLVVALDDRPGALATATKALGEAGINVSDLSMRHASAGDRGALLVRIDATAEARAISALAGVDLAAHVEPGEAP
ncbi:MAG: prephenate dehydrogenase/arogenate dehydrogenase family protein [Nitriliruptor sp.]|uniref:prephenate dehydrogenase/arogenate dehydrogenase family protein n=1 Tax=Nitriliruptor sp. TaxID=2448056 RepID=UPI0034A03103